MQEQHEERRRRRLEGLDDGDNDDDGENDDGTSNQGRKNGKGKKKHAYQSSGPGDSHIISHIHFLYQRLLKKFHYPVEVIVNYAAFAREHKSFHVMSRVYAEGLQHHPREEGLWIEAASFEFFGYVIVQLIVYCTLCRPATDVKLTPTLLLSPHTTDTSHKTMNDPKPPN